MTEAERAAFAANAEKLVNRVQSDKNETAVRQMQLRLLACDPDTRGLTFAFPALAWECNPTGVIHGGMLSAMFDTAMGITTYALTDTLTPTISLTTSYLRPAPGEGTLIVRTSVTMAGRSVLYASAEMWEQKTPDKLIATAQAAFHRYH